MVDNPDEKVDECLLNRVVHYSQLEVQKLPLYKQGIVTYMSLVEAFATEIKIFDWQKVCLTA